MTPIAQRTYETLAVCETWARQNKLPRWQETGVINLAYARELVESDAAVMATKRTTREEGGKVFVTEQLMFRRTNAG